MDNLLTSKTMTFSKKHLETLKNCYLIKPGVDRRKSFYCLRQGQVTEINNEEGNGIPTIYFRKVLKDDLFLLIKDLGIALRKNRVTGASDFLAEAVIILFIAYRQTSKVVSLEQVLDNCVDVDATIFVGIPTMAVMMSDPSSFIKGVPVGRFMIGGVANINHRRRFESPNKVLTDKTQNGSPKACAWIMRQPLSCRVIAAAFDESLIAEARECYLGFVTTGLSKQFKSDFEADQSIPCALGAAAIDTDVIFALEHLQLAIDFGPLGKSEYMIINSGAGDSIPENLWLIGEKDAALKRFIAEKPLGFCPDIDRLLGTYSRFLLKAKSHETSSRPSEAFIHCVFALDLALGGKHDTTKNTTRRSAAIYSCATGTSFQSAEKELRALFDARSKYVHEGVEVPEQKFELLLQICGKVTECLLLARHATLSNKERFITEHWYPRLDLVVAALNAGIDLGDSVFYSECGIKQPTKITSNTLH